MERYSGDTVDVAIVGFGPVGAALAGLLGKRGIRTAVFDKSEAIYPLPRAFALDHEAMRVFQEIGMADALLPGMTPYRPTIYEGADGQPIQHFDMGPPPYPLGWAPAYTFNQPALESALRQAVAAMPSVRVYLGHQVTEVREAGDGRCAEATVVLPDGTRTGLRAGYIVACDGGTSAIRQQLGLRLKSLEFDEPWVVVDLHVHEDQLSRLPATNVQYCRPERPCTYVVGPGTHRRWEFMLQPEEAARGPLPTEAIWPLLAPWLSPDQAQLWRAATYRFHAVVLESWRHGRTLFAGDAAHQMPPFLAQGMCQGLRDANNLAWKLAWVLEGRAGDALLDSYGQERGPQVEAVTHTVKRLGQIICERDPALAAERDRALRQQQGGVVAVQLRQSLLPGIRHGCIDADDGVAGTVFPQAMGRIGATAQATRMDDALPQGFLLFLRAPLPEASASALPRWLAPLDARAIHIGHGPATASALPFAETEGVLAAWFDRHRAVAALVRPDHTVYGVATTVDAVAGLLQRAADAVRQKEPAAFA